MSIHLLECAAAIKRLEPSWKLALMAFADSADRQERIGFPGLAQVMLWSGLSRSRAFEVINELEALGYLRKHRAGGGGRRAEYVVLPEGCCKEHGPVESDSGSDVSDSAGGPGSDGPDPNRERATERTPGSDASDPGNGQGPAQTGPSGSDKGPTDRTPSPTTTTSTTGSGSVTGPRELRQLRDEFGPTDPFCERHPGGTSLPCPACAARRPSFEKAEIQRAAARRRAEADTEIQASRRRKAETADVDSHHHAEEAKRLLAAAKTGGANS